MSAHKLERILDKHPVAERNDLFSLCFGHTDINVNARAVAAFAVFLQVGRDRCDYARDALSAADCDLLCGQHPFVRTAAGRDLQKSVIGDVGDDHSYLVAMRFKQKRLLTVIVRADCAVDVAERVGRYVCIFAQKLCGFLAC